MNRSRFRRLGAAATSVALIALATGSADAHVLEDFGPYSVALGWATEPTYVGALNAVQVVVKDKDGKGVTDLEAGALKVVVSVGGQSSSDLPLENRFDADTGLGTPGNYEASLTPTAPGDFIFHLTGSIHGQAVDETATSSDSTFDSVVEASAVEFPTKIPSLSEIVTRLDRIDARLLAAASGAPAGSASPAAPAPAPGVDQTAVTLAAARTEAAEARSAASTSLLVGVLLGGLGAILGGAALILAFRARNRG
ncbi:MAG TPA: hypothetical protein VIM30_16855 [Candidatus Limnocylindrales bacterium]|jgi:hypothetical protein